MWPALGLSPSAATAVSAWVHFSTYVATREQRLVKQLKTQIGKLAAAAAEAAAAPGKPAWVPRRHSVFLLLRAPSVLGLYICCLDRHLNVVHAASLGWRYV